MDMMALFNKKLKKLKKHQNQAICNLSEDVEYEIFNFMFE